MLGTTTLSVLAGYKRYAHITALRNDAVLPELLGMRKIVSEDAVRRAFKAIDEEEGTSWLRGHLAFCTEPLLAEPWILDVDTTIKPLYGHQEGAVLGYNPKKPGRPSHCYHTYSMAGARLALELGVGWAEAAFRTKYASGGAGGRLAAAVSGCGALHAEPGEGRACESGIRSGSCAECDAGAG